MKKIIFILGCIFLFHSVDAQIKIRRSGKRYKSSLLKKNYWQKSRTTYKTSSVWKVDGLKMSSLDDVLLKTIGVAAGNENVISMVKLGVLAQLPLQPKKGVRQENGIYNLTFYAGAEIHHGMFFIISNSLSINAGFLAGPVSIEQSVSRSLMWSPEVGKMNKMTSLNPKIGLILGRVWVKAGPSYTIRGSAPFQDWMALNGQAFNIEINYIAKWGE